ncbi:MAG: hypothetical protein FWB71_03755 [Defluviitaleaceae bacterium]|nr:hypothetical protein [Defluviitaleaceae bacterium]
MRTYLQKDENGRFMPNNPENLKVRPEDISSEWERGNSPETAECIFRLANEYHEEKEAQNT